VLSLPRESSIVELSRSMFSREINLPIRCYLRTVTVVGGKLCSENTWFCAITADERALPLSCSDPCSRGMSIFRYGATCNLLLSPRRVSPGEEAPPWSRLDPRSLRRCFSPHGATCDLLSPRRVPSEEGAHRRVVQVLVLQGDGSPNMVLPTIFPCLW
jgi:hypothetical protein